MYVRQRVCPSVVNDVARIVIEAQHLCPVDPVEDGGTGLGCWEHIAVGLHTDFQPVSRRSIAEGSDIGEIRLVLLFGCGIAGVGVDDLHTECRGNVDGPSEPGRALVGLQLRVPTEADRLQAEIRQFVPNAVDLPSSNHVRIDVLEPALDSADLAGAITGTGKSL